MNVAPPLPRPVDREDPRETLTRDGIGSLDELKAHTMRCRECPIGEFATQSVTGEGDSRARLMLVGEQPGDQEDLQGHPFVGPAGRLLARALERAGIPRERVFVSNAVKHFKFELRGKRRMAQRVSGWRARTAAKSWSRCIRRRCCDWRPKTAKKRSRLSPATWARRTRCSTSADSHSGTTVRPRP
jgi:hypothetical protein